MQHEAVTHDYDGKDAIATISVVLNIASLKGLLKIDTMYSQIILYDEISERGQTETEYA